MAAATAARVPSSQGAPQKGNPLDDFTLRLIRRKAKQICRRLGFSRSDVPDMEQELTLIVLRRAADFDPSRSHYYGFVTTVVERYTATILEHQGAEKRTPLRCGQSLNSPVADPDGQLVDLVTTLCSAAQWRRTGKTQRSHDEAANLVDDVAQVLQQLPPQLRKACELLSRASKAEAARQLGISHGALYVLLRQLSKRFEEAGLRDYLQ
jgi:RNA polymerase sigma factor (sigma-70 family)